MVRWKEEQDFGEGIYFLNVMVYICVDSWSDLKDWKGILDIIEQYLSLNDVFLICIIIKDTVSLLYEPKVTAEADNTDQNLAERSHALM